VVFFRLLSRLLRRGHFPATRRTTMNEETLFQLALEQPADKRAAFLEQHCAEDDLRQRVHVLLHAHDHPGDFLGQGPVPVGTTVNRIRSTNTRCSG
jgi:hypothetical protein